LGGFVSSAVVDDASPVVFERRLASETAMELRPPPPDDDDDSARRTMVATPRPSRCRVADVVVFVIIGVAGGNRVEQ
jgi:hypothetical protein